MVKCSLVETEITGSGLDRDLDKPSLANSVNAVTSVTVDADSAQSIGELVSDLHSLDEKKPSSRLVQPLRTTVESSFNELSCSSGTNQGFLLSSPVRVSSGEDINPSPKTKPYIDWSYTTRKTKKLLKFDAQPSQITDYIKIASAVDKVVHNNPLVSSLIKENNKHTHTREFSTPLLQQLFVNAQNNSKHSFQLMETTYHLQILFLQHLLK